MRRRLTAEIYEVLIKAETLYVCRSKGKWGLSKNTLNTSNASWTAEVYVTSSLYWYPSYSEELDFDLTAEYYVQELQQSAPGLTRRLSQT